MGVFSASFIPRCSRLWCPFLGLPWVVVASLHWAFRFIVWTVLAVVFSVVVCFVDIAILVLIIVTVVFFALGDSVGRVVSVAVCILLLLVVSDLLSACEADVLIPIQGIDDGFYRRASAICAEVDLSLGE